MREATHGLIIPEPRVRERLPVFRMRQSDSDMILNGDSVSGKAR